MFMLTLAVLAAAQGASGAPILWKNVEFGMPVEQVRSLYPASEQVRHRDDRITVEDYAVSANCQAKVDIHHEGGTVRRVVMRGEAAIGGRCSEAVLASLSERYGTPVSRKKLELSPFARDKRTYQWERDGVRLSFKRYTSGGYAGIGFTGPSWELTYSTRGADEA